MKLNIDFLPAYNEAQKLFANATGLPFPPAAGEEKPTIMGIDVRYEEDGPDGEKWYAYVQLNRPLEGLREGVFQYAINPKGDTRKGPAEYYGDFGVFEMDGTTLVYAAMHDVHIDKYGEPIVKDDYDVVTWTLTIEEKIDEETNVYEYSDFSFTVEEPEINAAQ